MQPDLDTATGPTIWGHAGSLDALYVLHEVADRMAGADPKPRFVFSCIEDVDDDLGSATALPTGSIAPYNAFLTNHSPQLALFAATPLQAGVFNLAHRAKIPVTLIHPDLATAKRKPWLWRKTTLASAMRSIDQCFSADGDAADSVLALGAPAAKVRRSPVMQSSIMPPRCDEAERAALADLLGGRPVWFAHQVPTEELDWILPAIQSAQRSWPRLITILDMANPEDIPGVRRHLIQAGFVVHDRAYEGEPDASTQIFLTDGPDETALWYQLAGLSYLGGTLSGLPCPNPLIAASLGSAIMHGPRIVRHKESYARLLSDMATTQLAHGRHMGQILTSALAPDACANTAHAAWDVISRGAEMTDILIRYIADKLDLITVAD